MKNHFWVPLAFIKKLSNTKNCKNCLNDLLKYKFIVHCSKPYEGYSLTYYGYDTLAIIYYKKVNILKSIV